MFSYPPPKASQPRYPVCARAYIATQRRRTARISVQYNECSVCLVLDNDDFSGPTRGKCTADVVHCFHQILKLIRGRTDDHDRQFAAAVSSTSYPAASVALNSFPLLRPLNPAHCAVWTSCSGKLCLKSSGTHSSSNIFIRSSQRGIHVLPQVPESPSRE